MAELHTLHDNIASESVTIVADNVSMFIQNKNRLINIFAENEIELIQQLAQSPSDESLNEQLDSRIKYYFPNYFTFTIADNSGEPLLEDFDGFIGEICEKDIKRFANHERPLPRIHPNFNSYHFDIITKYGNDEGILFVSFRADILGNIIKSVEAYNHQLLLIMEAGQDLIEVTSDGARNHWNRDDYRLQENEKKRTLATKYAPGTVWTAIDLNKPALFSSAWQRIITHSIITSSVFIFISIVFIYSMSRIHKRRARAESIRDEFLSAISHELRTPLTSIHGSLGLISSGVSGDISGQAKVLTRKALKNTDRMIILVNDLLDLKKLDAGQISLEMQPVNLVKITRNSIYLTQDFGKEFGVTFSLTINGEIYEKDSDKTSNGKNNPQNKIMVMANERRIEQAINNLLCNAAKYGAANETVEVALSIDTKMARIEIRDKGPGVSPSFQPTLFEKFTHTPTDVTEQGVGRGLAIVNYIVKLHHGRVGYEMRTGYGAIFFFEIPLITKM